MRLDDEGGRPVPARRVGAGRGTDRHRLRRWLPAAFLLLSLGVAGFGALEAYRAERSHAETARGVLTDYGEFAAWSYNQRVQELLGAALDATFAVTRQNRAFLAGDATEQCLSLLLDPETADACGCGDRLAGRFAFFFRLDDPAGAAAWGGEPPEPHVRDGLVDEVRRHAREGYQERWPFTVHHLADGTTVGYVRIAARDGLDPELRPSGDTLVYAVELDRDGLAQVLERALATDILLPPTLTRGRPNAEVIQVEVTGPDGGLLFASRPGEPHAYPAESGLRSVLGGGTVRASVLPTVAQQLVIGGLPENRTPVLLLIFALAGALAVAAIVQLRREHRLGLLRQDFVASVSHELRTPLAQVRLFTETLRLGRTRDEAERDWALENIDRETLRLTHLVEKILHFSRTERGVRPGDVEPLDLSGEVAAALEAFRPLVPATRARFEADVPDGLVAEADRDALRQVLLNFLDNAVRYGPAGQTVRVVGETGGATVRIAVEDEGPGVPPAERERIFEPFRRGEAAVGSVAAGSGIGLSVVREIAAALGGTVRVEDAPEGGARFVLELPALHTARESHFGRGGVGPADPTVAPAAGSAIHSAVDGTDHRGTAEAGTEVA